MVYMNEDQFGASVMPSAGVATGYTQSGGKKSGDTGGTGPLKKAEKLPGSKNDNFDAGSAEGEGAAVGEAGVGAEVAEAAPLLLAAA